MVICAGAKKFTRMTHSRVARSSFVVWRRMGTPALFTRQSRWPKASQASRATRPASSTSAEVRHPHAASPGRSRPAVGQHLGQAVLAPGHQAHRGPPPGQDPGQGGADPRRRAGHEHARSFDLHGASSGDRPRAASAVPGPVQHGEPAGRTRPWPSSTTSGASGTTTPPPTTTPPATTPPARRSRRRGRRPSRRCCRPAPARVLDCGAGTGFLSLIAARLGHRVTALDLSPRMLAKLERRGGGRGPRHLRGGGARPRAAVGARPTGGSTPSWSATCCGRSPTPSPPWRHGGRPAPGGRLVAIESLWGEADPLEALRARAWKAVKRWRGTAPDHHGPYPDAVRGALPLGTGTHPRDVARLVAEAGWVGAAPGAPARRGVGLDARAAPSRAAPRGHPALRRRRHLTPASHGAGASRGSACRVWVERVRCGTGAPRSSRGWRGSPGRARS